MAKYYGKYRGTVIDNVDPMQIGRLMVQVPDVSNVLPSTWAMPCLPFAGIQSGFYAVPDIGSGRLDRVRTGRSGLPHLGRLLTGPPRPMFPRSPWPRRPGWRRWWCKRPARTWC